MKSYRITDEHAAALLNGHLPEAREDLRHVADIVGALRLASFEAPPQPSAALAARLDLDRLAWVSAAQGTGVPGCDTERTTVLTRRPAKGKVKTALGWFTGLGLAAQLALGAGAVSASAAGIGMAGALPPVAQEVFDTVVATVAGADELLGGAFGDAEPDDDAGRGADDARTGVDGNGTDQDTPGDADAGSGGTDPGVQDGAGPDGPGHNGKPDISKPEKAEKPDKPEKPEVSGKAEKPDKPAKPEEAEKPNQAQKPGKADDAKPGKDDADPVPGGGDSNGKDADNAPGAGASKDKTGSTDSDEPGSAPAPDAGGDKAKADRDKPVKDSSAG